MPKQIIKSKKARIITVLTIFALASVLYLLADRYLIEHVSAQVPVSNSASTRNITESTDNVEADDWNYKSDNVSINIKKVQTGEGKDKITYFVADVQLSDSATLSSAFAKNEYGRNIVETTSKIASNNYAIFAINGDYYGFRSDGILIRNGILYRDKPARIAAALFKNGTLQTFDETEVSTSTLIDKGVTQTLSFGPVLIQNGKVADNLGNVSIDTNFGNRSIQGSNPRTGIGMISPNHLVFIVVDGRMENYSKGMTLSEFGNLFADLGCTEAYNLDGGGSSTMYFMGRVINNPLGKQEERAVSDILYIKE